MPYVTVIHITTKYGLWMQHIYTVIYICTLLTIEYSKSSGVQRYSDPSSSKSSGIRTPGNPPKLRLCRLDGLVERRELPERGPGRSPGRQRFWCILGLKNDADGTENIIFWQAGSGNFVCFCFIKQPCDNECGSGVSASSYRWVSVHFHIENKDGLL